MDINLMFKFFTELKPLTSVTMREAEKKKCSVHALILFSLYTILTSTIRHHAKH